MIKLIRLYQKSKAPNKAPKCKYHPSCSNYGINAYQNHNFIKATILTIWRILRCNPFSKGGYDPVPEQKLKLKNCQNEKILNFIKETDKIFAQKNFIPYSTYIPIKKEFEIEFDKINMHIQSKTVRIYAKKQNTNIKTLRALLITYVNFDIRVKDHNENFYKRQIYKENNYLENILSEIDANIVLDENQKKVVLNEQDNLLVIAGAGSGKTTTIVAKIKYLVEKKDINPNDILMISYTKKAVNELKERVNQSLNIPCQIKTFHQLGNDIIKENSTKKYSIAKAYVLEKCVIDYFSKMLKKQEIDFRYNNVIQLLAEFEISNDKVNNLEIITRDNFTSLVKLISNFINKFKVCGYETENFNSMIDNANDSRDKVFLKVAKEIYLLFQSKLRNECLIDFEDMINLATDILIEGKVNKYNYKYIFVDEYQDISKQRFYLLNALSKLTQAKIVAVGDDWQSIYAFAGSNLKLFVDFQKSVGFADELYIENTYRNSQELINVAGRFIQKNSYQKRKNLCSNKSANMPISIYTYGSSEKHLNYEKCIILRQILGEISRCETTGKRSVLLVGRFNFDMNFLSWDSTFSYDSDTGVVSHDEFLNLDISFLTAHSAKGLGYDEVIFINGASGVYGFPSRQRTDDLLRLVTSDDLDYEFAEERRLFYVALTRTKNKVYMIVPRDNPSEFVIELLKDKRYSGINVIGKGI